jgi:hypothetical protein
MKHIGRHGERKVAIVYKTVPDQDHMALVVYTETMNMGMHDAMMKVIESKEGQAENELADVLFRNLFTDGRKMLETLHREGMLKKVEARQIIVTPNAKSSVNLGELNEILAEMNTGKDAADRLANIDANAGLVDPTNKVQNESSSGALDDNALAQQQLAQAQRMENEAKSLISESKLLAKEAYKLDASLKPKTKKKTLAKKKVVAKKTPSSKKSTAKTKVKAKATSA